MKDKKKLSLKALQVESFVTSLELNEKQTVNGAGFWDDFTDNLYVMRLNAAQLFSRDDRKGCKDRFANNVPIGAVISIDGKDKCPGWSIGDGDLLLCPERSIDRKRNCRGKALDR